MDPGERDGQLLERALWLKPWQRTLRVVIYRTRVQHETRKNFQLDLFDPADGHYEYSAVVTNKTLSGRYLWSFMCGRGGHEKAYGELKSGFAFASVPSFQYAANSAWQLISVLAFNLMRSFQVAHRADAAPAGGPPPAAVRIPQHSYAALRAAPPRRPRAPSRRQAHARCRNRRRRAPPVPRDRHSPASGSLIYCHIKASIGPLPHEEPTTND